MFWNIRRTLTHNRLINVIVGNRGGGKTYGSKEWCIDNYLKTGEQFGYIRRYRDELKTTMLTFFDDIKDKYPDYEFKSDTRYLYIRLRPDNEKQKWTENDIAGYAFTLSTSAGKKSVSYPKITTLIFDEFLLDKGMQRYLTDEPIKLLNLYETISRPGTGHPKVVLFMLANALTITNPYFLFWDLKMPTKADKNGKYIWKHKTRPILVEDVRNEQFIDVKRGTEFGALVQGTKYAEYSIENKFLLDSEEFIEKRTSNAKHCFTFYYNDVPYGVWVDIREGKMWVSEAYDPSCLLKYTLTLKDHRPNTMFFKSKSKGGYFKMFIENYKLGNVYFENQKVKNIAYEVIQMTMNV